MTSPDNDPQTIIPGQKPGTITAGFIVCERGFCPGLIYREFMSGMFIVWGWVSGPVRPTASGLLGEFETATKRHNNRRRKRRWHVIGRHVTLMFSDVSQ